ncbi:MAG TPA: glycosyltransferase family 4 protein [Gaiellaceae bacterium]|nr:glycosyltransferase family 4 protein [Gaiellaceae bacterium]
MATRQEQSGERRRILVCTPFPPRLDARHGGKAPAQLLARLAARNEVGILCLRSDAEEPVDPEIRERCAYVEEVAIGPAANGWRQRVRWSLGLLEGLPPWAVNCRTPAYAERLRRVVADRRPDVVEFHLQVMAQYASVLDDSDIPRVLVDYDPGSAWAADLVRTSSGLRRLARRAELTAWRRYERATRPRFQSIVVFADRDVEPVSRTARGVPVARIPLAIEVPKEALDPVGAAPPTVLFVGGFGHPPNVDAARWLAGSIFPRVRRQVPEAELELVGHAPGDDVLRLQGEGVAVHGSVADVTPFLDRAAVVVAPIRIGGSMRMKVLEALAAGKALVATPRAAEGIEAVPGTHYLLADSEDEVVEKLVGLLLDGERRRELATSARAWAVQKLSWDESVASFERLYDSLQATA